MQCFSLLCCDDPRARGWWWWIVGLLMDVGTCETSGNLQHMQNPSTNKWFCHTKRKSNQCKTSDKTAKLFLLTQFIKSNFRQSFISEAQAFRTCNVTEERCWRSIKVTITYWGPWFSFQGLNVEVWSRSRPYLPVPLILGLGDDRFKWNVWEWGDPSRSRHSRHMCPKGPKRWPFCT